MGEVNRSRMEQPHLVERVNSATEQNLDYHFSPTSHSPRLGYCLHRYGLLSQTLWNVNSPDTLAIGHPTRTTTESLGVRALRRNSLAVPAVVMCIILPEPDMPA